MRATARSTPTPPAASPPRPRPGSGSSPGPTGCPSLGRSAYRPPKGLRRFIEYRDGTCQFPGCTRAARKAEIDHLTEWQDGGTTDAENLHALCTKHHALKSLQTWTRPASPPAPTTPPPTPSGSPPRNPSRHRPHRPRTTRPRPTRSQPTGWHPTGGRPARPTRRQPTGWHPTGGRPARPTRRQHTEARAGRTPAAPVLGSIGADRVRPRDGPDRGGTSARGHKPLTPHSGEAHAWGISWSGCLPFG
ncbi:HNH endonuclease signature motif containing protein [Sinomonas sp. P47F7]|uniref:HNH endonuclease signature motif containing protein n=1 Tax=Sinomonas sp. P47F7 TaxID=3410987 RepID=UPI003BF4A5A0